MSTVSSQSAHETQVEAVDPISWLLQGQRPAPAPITFTHLEVPGRISVIVPLFNGKKFIERTLGSIWEQTLSPDRIELIVVDDGSTDRSLKEAERLRGLSPMPMQVITHPNRENRGVSATRNRGFRHASGEYIALLDCDDLFLPRRLQAAVEHFEAHPECHSLCSLGHCVDEAGNPVVGYNGTRDAGNYRAVSPDLEPPFTFEQLWKHYPIANSTIGIRRRALGETGGYPEQMAHQAEDWLLMLKLSLYAPVAFLNEHLIQYTHHAESYTTRNRAFESAYGCRIEVFHLLAYWMLQHPQFRDQGVRFYRREYPTLMSQQHGTPDLRDVPGILKRALLNGVRLGPIKSVQMLSNTLRQHRANRIGKTGP